MQYEIQMKGGEEERKEGECEREEINFLTSRAEETRHQAQGKHLALSVGCRSNSPWSMPSSSRRCYQKDNNVVIQARSIADSRAGCSCSGDGGKAAWPPSPETGCDQN